MTQPTIKTITVHALKTQWDKSPELCLIDVREHHEREALRIPNTLHMPKDTLAAQILLTPLNKSQPLYVHCRSGVRSLHAAQTLLNMGYDTVYSVQGGIIEWENSGYPVDNG